MNPFKQCRRYNLTIWQCPSFLFVLMGLIIIAAMIGTYIIASGYVEEPQMAALIVIIISVVLLVIGNAIVSSFNRIAESNIIKTEFLRIVSHHLRGPLTALKWTLSSIDAVEIKKYSPAELEILDALRQNVGEMSVIINDLVNANLIETKRLKLLYEETSPVKITERAIKNLSYFANLEKVSLNFEIKGKVPEKIFADSDKLYLCLGNLIDNGIRYNKEGGWVRVVLEPVDFGLKWSVVDNGIGIAEEDQKRLFQKFFRTAGAKQFQTSGTGLGLFNTKAFIEAMGGKIGFESKEGKGSIFWFMIPIK